MSKFITGKDLEDAVYNIIWEAESQLMIVSPYIKLDAYFKKLFEKHLNSPKLHITLLFGKNEGRINKSFNKADLDFFKQFPNISIIYVPNLHAKYYANEYTGVLTSINLYDFSFKNNIEFGVLYEPKSLNVFSKSPDAEVWDKSKEIADTNDVVFISRPIYEFKLISSNIYKGSKVLYDVTEELYFGKSILTSKQKLSNFEDILDFGQIQNERPTREEVEKLIPAAAKVFNATTAQKNGYCIRTGVEIPFNPERPLSYQAYQSWRKFSNEEYPEKYCHYSGELSMGETSVNRPILRKNWQKSKGAIKP